MVLVLPENTGTLDTSRKSTISCILRLRKATRFSFTTAFHAVTRRCKLQGQGAFENVTEIVRRKSGYVTQISTAVRSGEYTGTIGKPAKLALMGFSFGSYITYSTIAAMPDIANAPDRDWTQCHD